MWMDPVPEKLFNEMAMISCKRHEEQVKNLPDFSKLVKKKKKIFWMMKIHIMDPFLFSTDYNDIPDGWLKHSKIFPENDIPLDNTCDISTEMKEKILLFDSVSTYTLASLSRVCCICDDLETEEELVEYYDAKFCTEYASDLSELETLRLEDALAFVDSFPVFKEIRKHYEGCDKTQVDIAFLVSYYFYLDISNDPEIALSFFDDIFDEVRGETKNNDYKACGNEEYKQQRYEDAVKSYTLALTLNPYSYYCFGNRAQCFLKLNKHCNAEMDCHAVIILRPEWCKGYYKLARALEGQKKVHEAHRVADFGMKQCDTVSHIEFASLQECRDSLQKDCKICKVAEEKSPLLNNAKGGLKIKAPDFDNLMDVPELTDSSETDSSEEEAEEEEEEGISSQNCVTNAVQAEKSANTSHQKEKSPDPIKSPQMKNKKEEVKPTTAPEHEPVELEEVKVLRHFHNFLSKGSSAMANGSSLIAKQHFCDALFQLKVNPELYKLDLMGIITLKYAYASACCKSGTLENLLKAISAFNEIINEHPDVVFPAALYGLGLSYFKLNKFKESLNYFKKLSSELGQCGNLTIHNWPGTENPIEETSITKLKALLEELIKESECPPPPDALCRYEKCSLQPVIYFSDPDFKGFMSVQCHQRCSLQYHVTCWKSIREAFDRTDKEFIDSSCLTPDCGGFIMRVETVGKNGSVEKYFESEERLPKKNVKHKKTKLEKRFEIREQRKMKRHKSETQDKAVEETCDQVAENCGPLETCKPDVEDKVSEKEKLNFAECPQNTPSKSISSSLSATAQPFYVIKKEVENKLPELKTKHKEKKKQKKSTFSIDEFCGNYSGQDLSYYNEYQMRLHRLQETRRVIEESDAWPTFCETERIPELDPNRPYHIPEGLRNDPDTLETVLQSCGPIPQNANSKALKEYLYPRFENILQEKGTLNVNDPIVTDELQDLPGEWQEIINESGGFKSFILQSMKFAVVEDTLCFFTDMLNVYKSSEVNDLDDFNQVYGSDLSLGAETVVSQRGFEENVSDLNPNAAEYSPSESKSDISLDYTTVGNSHSIPLCPDTRSEKLLCSFQSSLANDKGLKLGGVLNHSNNSVVYAGKQPSTDGGSCENSSTPNTEVNEPLLKLLSNLRQPINNYSMSSHAKSGSIPLENSTMSSSKTISIRKGFQIEVFVEKFLSLKSQLSAGCHPRDVLENIQSLADMLSWSDNLEEIQDNLASEGILNCVAKVDKCEQAGSPEITMTSQGVMKEDEELKKALEQLQHMSTENRAISDRRLSLENQLVEALDSVSKLQNKLSVELPALEKQLDENKIANKEDCKILKSKISLLERELKQWRQKYDSLADTEKECNKENAKLKVKINSYVSKLEEMGKKCAEYENKVTNQSIIVKKCEKMVQENSLLLDKRIKECSEACERAKKSEVELLLMKKNLFLPRLDTIIKDGNQKIQELQKTLNASENVFSPFMAMSLQMLLSKLKDHAEEILKVRITTQKKVDGLISKVQSGIPLSDLEEFDFPALPQMPNSNDFIPQHTPQMAFTDQMNLSYVHGLPPVSESKSNPTTQQNFLQPVTSIPPHKSSTNNKYFPWHLSHSMLHQASMNSSDVSKAANYLYSSQKSFQNTGEPNSYANQVPGFPSMTNQPVPPHLQVTTTIPSKFPVKPFPPLFPMTLPSTTASTQANPSVTSSKFYNDEAAAKQSAMNDSNKASSSDNHGHAATEAKVATLGHVLTEKVPSGATSRSISPLAHQSSRCLSVSSENVGGDYHDGDESGSVNSYHSLPLSKNNNNSSVPQPGSAVQLQTRDLSAKSTLNNSKSGTAPGLELDYTALGPNAPASASAGGASKPNPQALQRKTQKVGEKKGSYVKILEKLRSRYPEIPEPELLNFVRNYREEKKRLTGMPIDGIVNGVAELVERTLRMRHPQVPIIRTAKTIVNKPIVSVPQPEPPKPIVHENPWGKAQDSEKSARLWSGESADKSCIICLEDMTHKDSMKVECGHRFHRACIKQWLHKTSNCPTCRVHLLLPEDYPALS